MDHAGGEEDDGYLVTYVHNEASGESSMVVYDAKTMAAEPVARVVCVKTKSSCLMAVTVVVQSHETQSFFGAHQVLPQRVPYGFHGEWMSEEQFASQAPAAA